jgi:hypothetical protein
MKQIKRTKGLIIYQDSRNNKWKVVKNRFHWDVECNASGSFKTVISFKKMNECQAWLRNDINVEECYLAITSGRELKSLSPCSYN